MDCKHKMIVKNKRIKNKNVHSHSKKKLKHDNKGGKKSSLFKRVFPGNDVSIKHIICGN